MEPSRADLTALIRDPIRFLDSDSAVLRRMSVSNLRRDQVDAAFDLVAGLAADSDDSVRAAAVEALGSADSQALPVLLGTTDDPAPQVREAVATAMGEVGDARSCDWLISTANSDPDRGVREAAVAALGSIGDQRALEPLLMLVSEGPPPVRRRAIAAITVFDDPRIEPAIRRAALDRNPGVREAAEIVVGRQLRPEA
ncbi:MAG: HEAT repeat domain-containing protein [Acidimicrobiia bacterium]|nr:HEAT repeat domain-containing protein [Acidimicrobiia bacterium]